jgi:hypothetical protein
LLERSLGKVFLKPGNGNAPIVIGSYVQILPRLITLFPSTKVVTVQETTLLAVATLATLLKLHKNLSFGTQMNILNILKKGLIRLRNGLSRGQGL